jgi:hypothetical protein
MRLELLTALLSLLLPSHAQALPRSCPESPPCGLLSVLMHAGQGDDCVESCVLWPLLEQRTKSCGACPTTRTAAVIASSAQKRNAVAAPVKAPVKAVRAPVKAPVKAPVRKPPPPTAPPAFTIDIQFVGDIPAADQAIFQSAKARWESVIVGDKLDFETAGIVSQRLDSACVLPRPTIDDLYICAKYEAIDGNEKIVGIAGPNFSRQDGTAAIGSMTFDTADIALLNRTNSLKDTILHEMGHVIGRYPSSW